MKHTDNIILNKLQRKTTDIIPLWHKQILNWYQQYGRNTLPWRNLNGVNAPYGVYVSEIMLQQTQVKRVLESYYTPFMTSFPTLQSLAIADEENVLKHWEGLGYYTRARNMQKTAQICCEKFNNALPQTYAELISLPGIGAYSAGAILCFGFKQSVSFVDGNIRRLLCRIFALQNATMPLLEELSTILLDQKHSFDYNQALLDIGATICTPKSPSCLLCPVHNLCDGYTNPTLYPKPKKSHLHPLELHLALCIDANGKIAFIQGDKSGLYQGLYNLPNLEKEQVVSYEKCGSFKHHYTKYAITANVYIINQDTFKHLVPQTNLYFFSYQELDSKPLSSLCKKALKFVDSKKSK